MRAALIAALVACSPPAETPTAAPGTVRREAKAARGELVERVLLTGQLKAASAVDFNVPKTEMWQLTIRWMAEDGALVKAGEKVLEFDNSQFTNGLNQKHLQLLEANSGLRAFRDLAAMNAGVKQFEVQQHQVALDKATLLASVPADLQPQRTAQERQLDKTRAQEALKRSEEALATERQSSSLEAKVKQIDLDKSKRAIESAEKSIADLEIKAPRDGVILVGTHPWEGRRFQIGDSVQPGFTIVTLPDLSQPMKVAAELSDVDDGKVALGMAGTCTLDAYPREPIACTIEELAPVARGNNMESLRRVFAITLKLEKSDPERMRPGMSVKVELPQPTKTGGILVPRGALVVDSKQPPKVRLASGELRDVTLGACDAQRCVIDKGIAEGDAVLEGP